MDTTTWIIIIVVILILVVGAIYAGISWYFDKQIKNAAGIYYTKVTTDVDGNSSSSVVCVTTEYDSNKAIIKPATHKVDTHDASMFFMWNPKNWPWFNKNYTIISDSDALSWDSSINAFVSTDSSKDFMFTNDKTNGLTCTIKQTTTDSSKEPFLVNETNSGIMNASELYPTENPAEFRPANSAYTDLSNNNFLDTGFHFQMNTTMSTNKNPDLQQGLRESIEVPVSYVGPWQESSWQQYVPLK